tara:strand:+ start:259 stop:651 length:393 start_codon:yes stop_codon:yes gene_type:complete
MALRLTRSVDSILYGGENLDPDNLEGSFDHRLWVRRVKDYRGKQDALVNVTSKEGVSEHVLLTGDEGIWLGQDINVSMVGVQTFFMKAKQYCEACGRGDVVSDKMVPQAQLAVNAPRKYELIRHDARKKK